MLHRLTAAPRCNFPTPCTGKCEFKSSHHRRRQFPRRAAVPAGLAMATRTARRSMLCHTTSLGRTRTRRRRSTPSADIYPLSLTTPSHVPELENGAAIAHAQTAQAGAETVGVPFIPTTPSSAASWLERRVRVFNDRGCVRTRQHFSNGRCMPGVVMAPIGMLAPRSKRKGATVHALTPRRLRRPWPSADLLGRALSRSAVALNG